MLHDNPAMYRQYFSITGQELWSIEHQIFFSIVEQDHRFIKRRVAAKLGFASFRTAARTLKGYEAMDMIRKGQIDWV